MKLLICDNLFGYGRLVSRKLRRCGFETDICAGEYSDILDHLSARSYDGLFFYVCNADEQLFGFMELVRGLAPDMLIYAAFYRDLPLIEMQLEERFSVSCDLMPLTPNEICNALIAMLLPPGDPLILPVLEDHLISCRLSRCMLGFSFVSAALEVYITDPSLAYHGVTRVYKAVARKLQTSFNGIRTNVSASLRSAVAHGFRPTGILRYEKLSDHDVLLVMADEFTGNYLDRLL